jgi:predicted secreted protein
MYIVDYQDKLNKVNREANIGHVTSWPRRWRDQIVLVTVVLQSVVDALLYIHTHVKTAQTTRIIVAIL